MRVPQRHFRRRAAQRQVSAMDGITLLGVGGRGGGMAHGVIHRKTGLRNSSSAGPMRPLRCGVDGKKPASSPPPQAGQCRPAPPPCFNLGRVGSDPGGQNRCGGRGQRPAPAIAVGNGAASDRPLPTCRTPPLLEVPGDKYAQPLRLEVFADGGVDLFHGQCLIGGIALCFKRHVTAVVQMAAQQPGDRAIGRP